MILLWIGFLIFVALLLALDLGVFHRHAHVVSTKEALSMSAVWIGFGLLFAVFIYFGYENHWLGLGSLPDPVDGVVNNGQAAAIKYVTGYIVEKSLSVDNIFVMAMVFAFFAVPSLYQHRVLFWGVIGALLLRGIMIVAGAALIAEFHWILYLFAVFLIMTAAKMLFMETEASNLESNIVVRLARRLFSITAHYHGEHFWLRAGSPASHESEIPSAPVVEDVLVDREKAGTLMLTPLALALVVVETTDVIFAVDSIPAIFAITGDPFLVFTSNVFALLGLRSLYFALAGMIQKFRYLKPALAIILFVVGVKMLLASFLKRLLGDAFDFYLLGTIFVILGIAIAASMLHKVQVEPSLSRRG